jgi:hypothetical protein
MKSVWYWLVLAMYSVAMGLIVPRVLLMAWPTVKAQTSTLGTASRWLVKPPQRFAPFTVYELQDNQTDSCYIVIVASQGVSVTPPQPCPE